MSWCSTFLERSVHSSYELGELLQHYDDSTINIIMAITTKTITISC